MKTRHYFLLSGFCALGSALSADWSRVVDFEEYDLTDQESEIQAEGWIFQDYDFAGYPECVDGSRDCTGVREIVAAPYDGNGKAILIRGSDPEEVDPANTRSGSAFPLGTEIPVGESAMFYLRFAAEGREISAHFGLTSDTGPMNDNADNTATRIDYPDLAVTSQVSFPSRETLGVYNGFWRDATLDSTEVISPETWYELWYHIRNESPSNGGGYFDIYIRGGVFTDVTLLENPYLPSDVTYTDWVFRDVQDKPLARFVNVSNSGNPVEFVRSDAIFFDDMYLDLSVDGDTPNLTTPPLRAGDVVTGPESLWDDVQADSNGWKQTPWGWVYDAKYPWIYQYPADAWLYILAEGSTKNSIYFYDASEGDWFWGSELYGAWHFNLQDPTYGNGGWAAW
jgi:hypothetical protein